MANCLTELGFKILNVILGPKQIRLQTSRAGSLRIVLSLSFGHVSLRKTSHYFDYQLMKEMNGQKQMTDVWQLPAIASWEKLVQNTLLKKPLALLTRIILASTRPNDWILDPFAGSSTTGIAANLFGRRYLGVEQESDFLDLSKARRTEIEQLDIVSTYREKIFKQLSRQSNGYNYEPLTDAMQLNDEVSDYNISALPF